jgi:hypothetical protein
VKADLRMKAEKFGKIRETNTGKNIKNTANLTLDYSKLCYCLEIVSDRPIVKYMIKGDIKLLEGEEKKSFEGQ